ncbi:hypothetical protein ACFL1C_08115 [Pseudomonadota bacterium]
MSVFLGTLIIVSLCCLAMSLGLLLSGKPFRGGCGSKPPGTPRCEGCPRKNRHRPDTINPEGES